MLVSVLHALGPIIFAILCARWLSYELGKPRPAPFRHARWLGGMFVAYAIGLALSLFIDGIRGNFILHAVGGGVVSALAYAYIIKTTSIRVSRRVLTIALFAFVSTLGVLNELAEYAAELVGAGIYSLGPQDTWRDFVANTLGAYLMWVVILLAGNLAKKRHEPTKKG